MNKKIITISGYSGSGKSTLINSIEKEYNFNIIEFGMVHKECVKKSGYLYAKDWIREQGFIPYEKKLLVCFKNKLISTINNNNNNNIIIDGIFSDKCFLYMRSVSSINLTNIVLDTSYNERLRRMMEREKLNYDDAIQHLYTTDCIKEHAGLSNILKDYDYIIDGHISKEKIKEECLLILQSVGVDIPQSRKRELEKTNI